MVESKTKFPNFQNYIIIDLYCWNWLETFTLVSVLTCNYKVLFNDCQVFFLTIFNITKKNSKRIVLFFTESIACKKERNFVHNG